MRRSVRVDLVEVGTALASLLEPDQVAGVDARDLADRPAEVASERQHAAGGTAGRTPGAAGAVPAGRVVELVVRRRRAMVLGLLRRWRRVAGLTRWPRGRAQCPGGSSGVDLRELVVVFAPAFRVADLVEGRVDDRHLMRRPVTGHVGMESSREGAIGGRHRSVVRRGVDAEDRVGIQLLGSGHPSLPSRRGRLMCRGRPPLVAARSTVANRRSATVRFRSVDSAAS